MDRTRIFTAVALGLMISGLIAFWGFRPVAQGPTPAPGPEPEVAVLGPAETQRGSVAWQHRAAWVERNALAEPESRGLGVLLTDARTRPHALERRVRLGAVHFFPTPDEAPLPRGEPTRLLEELLAVEAAQGDSATAEQSFLEATRAARLDPTDGTLVQDPWRALLVLETERRRALRKSADAEGGARGRWIERLASRLIEVHPGTAVADYAWLYRLEVLGDPTWDTFDPAAAGRLGVLALDASSDALVRAVAVERITASAGHTDGLLPQLDAAWETGDATTWLAAAGADHAVSSGQASGVQVWLSRLVDAIDLVCDEAVGGTCRAWRMEAGWGQAQQDAILGNDGETWREHAAIAAWRCHVWRERLSAASLSGTAVYDGSAWSWRSWSADGDAGMFPGCIEAEVFFGPHPDEPVELTLQIETYGKPPSHLTP